MTTTAATFVPPLGLPTGVRASLTFEELSLLKHAASAVTLDGYTTQSVYSVYDKHNRRLGFVVSAVYDGEKRATWFAVDNDGRASTYVMERRAEALAALEVMAAARIVAGLMKTAHIVPKNG